MTDTTHSSGVASWAPPAPPPPAPPPAPAKKGRTGLVVGVCVVLVLVIAGVVVAVTQGRSDEPSTLTFHYSITLLDDFCDHEFDSFDGYGDITDGATVEVIDGTGNLLGFGELGPCDSTTTYSAVFPVKRAGDGVYRVTAGNDNRGYLNYTEADVVDGNIYAEATLGG